MRPALVPVYALKFLIELVGWAGTGVLAFQLTGNWVLAIALPIVVIVLWALFIAPKAPKRLPIPPLVACELLVFAAATAGFILAGWTVFAIVFAVVIIPVEIVLVATRSYDLR
ncbi:MAG: hypothetical protein BGO97_11910 [Micrococcales bacterium 70-64]|nr:YrdB family protein [Leifsonia sp.]ODU64667.1 MAG: hypothetical protein ABT06_11910 [Leifsonia sp. SCN 70-46]OJX86358.1 MAG: hypothetical protein BGO97_11910 [Micrococcales bacterium 70-64]